MAAICALLAVRPDAHASTAGDPRIAVLQTQVKALQKQVDEFNARYPVGQMVTVRRDAGNGILTKTRSEAQVLSGHSAVIWLEGISGCYLLDRVTPVTDQVPA